MDAVVKAKLDHHYQRRLTADDLVGTDDQVAALIRLRTGDTLPEINRIILEATAGRAISPEYDFERWWRFNLH